MGYKAERCNDDTNKNDPDSRMHKRHIFFKKLDENIVENDKNDSNYGVPEQLHLAMKVGLREYHMPGKNKPNRECDTERCYPGHYIHINSYIAKKVQIIFL